MRRLRVLLTGLVARRRLEGDLADEIAFHIESRARQLMAEGLDAAAARRRARVEFGSIERYKEEARAGRGLRLADEIRADVRAGCRGLGRSPGFAVLAALSLALGIGANTLVFSVVDATLLRPLALPDPERLVTVWNLPDPANPDQLGTASIARFFAVRDETRSFASVAAHNGLACGLKTLGFDEPGVAAERLQGQTVSPSMFRTLGVEPMLGRGFTDAEDLADQVARVLVLSHGTWQRRFGGDPAIVGRTITFDRVPTTVIGVMPAGFDALGSQVEFYAPLCLTRIQVESRIGGNTIIARLRPGVTIAQAQAEVDALAAELARRDPDRHRGFGFKVEPLQRSQARAFGQNGQPGGDYAGPLLILQGSVAFVLLIACANVAGLLLARTASRRTEVAVRMALGAGRWRVIRQLVTESLPLAVIGALGGVALAWGGLAVFVATAPPQFPRLDRVGLDVRVLGFTAAVTLLTAVVFAALPAVQASRITFIDAVKALSRHATSGGRRQRARSMLAASQVALALVLLVGAGLMIHSFVRVMRNDLGGNTSNVLTFDFRYPQREGYRQLRMFRGTGLFAVSPVPADTVERVLERLRTLPGVVSVAAVNRSPFTGGAMPEPFLVEGRPLPPPDDARGAGSSQTADYIAVTRGYFETMGIPLRSGRDFDERDRRNAPFVVIVNETLARRYFPDADPVGRYMRFDFLPDEPLRQIVGVAGDTLSGPFQNQREPAVYVPHLQQTDFFAGPQVVTRIGMNFVVKTVAEPMTMLGPIKAAVAEVERSIPVADARTLEQSVDAQVRYMRLYTLLLVAFGVVSLLLAAVGIYGVMAHAVAERTREIGIRMALGARIADVLMMVLRHAALVSGAGVAAGLGASLLLGRLLEASLFQVSVTDPLTYAAVSAVLLAIVALACLIPTRRATAIDPTTALRFE